MSENAPPSKDNRALDSVIAALVAELIGAFLLTFIDSGVGIVAGYDPDVTIIMRSLAPGLFVMSFIYAFGDLAGAHINPAVTFAFALRGDFPWRLVPGYWLAQMSGSLLAAAVLRQIFGVINHLGATMPAHGSASALVIESIITFALVSTILGTANRHKIVGPNAAIASGGVIDACCLFAKPVSGASMNPARSFGPAVLGGASNVYWIYVVGPFSGAIVAVLIARILRGPPGRPESDAAQGEKAKSMR